MRSLTRSFLAVMAILAVAVVSGQMFGAGISAPEPVSAWDDVEKDYDVEQSQSPDAPRDLTGEIGIYDWRNDDGEIVYHVKLSWIPGDEEKRNRENNTFSEKVAIWEADSGKWVRNPIVNYLDGNDERVSQRVRVGPLWVMNDGTKRIILEHDREYTFRAYQTKVTINLEEDEDEYEYLYSNPVTLRTPAAPEQTEEQESEEEPPQPEEEDQEEPREKTKPSGLTAAQDGDAVTLNWTPGYNPNYVKQVVTRREAVKGTKLEVIHTFTREADEMEMDTYTDTTVEAGKRYIYRIKALKANGKGPMTNAAKITVK